MNTLRISSLVVACALVLAGGIAYYRYTAREPASPKVVTIQGSNDSRVSTSSTVENLDTSNWKTFRNEQMGFEMRYPDSWEVEIERLDGSIGTSSSSTLTSRRSLSFKRKGEGYMDTDSLRFSVDVIDSSLHPKIFQETYGNELPNYGTVLSLAEFQSTIELMDDAEPTFIESKNDVPGYWVYSQTILLKTEGCYFLAWMIATGSEKEVVSKHIVEFRDVLKSFKSR